jgi:hypothetical protein
MFLGRTAGSLAALAIALEANTFGAFQASPHASGLIEISSAADPSPIVMVTVDYPKADGYIERLYAIELSEGEKKPVAFKADGNTFYEKDRFLSVVFTTSTIIFVLAEDVTVPARATAYRVEHAVPGAVAAAAGPKTHAQAAAAFFGIPHLLPRKRPGSHW